MLPRKAVQNYLESMLSVLKTENIIKIVSSVLKIEKNVIFGVVAETIYVAMLMTAALALAAVLTLLNRL